MDYSVPHNLQLVGYKYTNHFKSPSWAAVCKSLLSFSIQAFCYYIIATARPCLGRLVGEERSAAVSLARVLSSFRETGADHGIRHRVPETVLSIWHRDLLLFIFKYLTRPLRKKRCSPRHLQRAPQPVEDHLRSSQSFPPAGPFSKYVLYPYINLSP